MSSSHRRTSSILSNISHPISNLFVSPRTQMQAVFLDDDDKAGESSKHAEARLLNGKEGEDTIRRVELQIGGMTCGACVAAIESQMKQPGVQSVQISLLAERGVVEYDTAFVRAKGDTWTDALIAEEIEDIGFEASVVEQSEIDQVELRIYGLEDSTLVEELVQHTLALAGVHTAELPFPHTHLLLTHSPTLISLRTLVDSLAAKYPRLNFLPVSTSENGSQLASLQRHKETTVWKRTFILSASFAIPVFFIGMMHMYLPHWLIGWTQWKIITGIYLGDLVCLFLTIPVQVWLARRFYQNAWKSVKHGSSTMDVLVVLGTSSAFSYSVIGMFLAMFSSNPDYHPQTFFDTSTMLITFVSMGRYIENLAKGKTSAALTDLMALTPSSATIYVDSVSPDEDETTKTPQTRKIPTELVQVGDIVLLVPGAKIPADGTVLTGSTSVDESMVTGEALPVPKEAESQVIGGTVNGLGTITFRVTRAGKDTALSQIVKLVEDAQTSKAPIQQFADRVAGVFVPIVITLSLLTLVCWMIISSLRSTGSLPAVFSSPGVSKFGVCLKLCISVVVVACPCALGLSTPTAVMVGTGVGAKNGILIKGGKALEACKNIKRVVVDKTGTITEGKMKVAAVAWAPTHHLSPELGLTSPKMAFDTASTLSRSTAAAPLQRHTILSLLSLAETRSEHPLAIAVAAHGRELLSEARLPPPNGEVIEFESSTGQGIEALVQLNGMQVKERIRIGKSSYVLAPTLKAAEASTTVETSTLPEPLQQFEAAQMEQARTVIFVSIVRSGSESPIPVLALALSDAPKPSSTQAIRSLQRMGIKVTMLTGDALATAQAVARQVGIDSDEVFAGVSPKGKAKIITNLINQDAALKGGGGVAMVGDGINDSPALVASSLGIALSSGASVAIEAADLVLMRSDLLDVVAALDLGQTIFRKIKWNLVWACCYNVFMIPLAMGFFLPWGFHLHPMMAAAAMAFSSVSVVLSSLTLKWWKRPESSIIPGEAFVQGGFFVGVSELAGEYKDWVAGSIASIKRVGQDVGRRGSTLPLLRRLSLRRGSLGVPRRNEYESIPLDRGSAVSPLPRGDTMV